MRKMKKILAMLLAFVMVFGLTITASAETDNESPYTADITVNGLVDGEATTVKVYQAISLSEGTAEYESVVANSFDSLLLPPSA